MEVNTKNFREVQSIQLSQCVTSIQICSDFLAAGCLDDNVYMWTSEFTNFKKQPILAHSGNSMGIIDLKFNKINTNLAISCLDSTIKLYDIDTRQFTSIQCQVMQNWKIQFIGNNIATCGDHGRIGFFDLISKQKVKKLQTGEIFLTSITKTNDQKFLASGNNSGDVYIVNLSNKDKLVSLKPHYKMVRSLSFTQDCSKLLSSSDDYTIKLIDIASQSVISNLQGHKQAVTKVVAHPNDNKLVYSCSFDKTVKCWDLRLKSCIGSAVTGSSLWSLGVFGKNVVCGGDNGVLNIYSIE